MRSIVMLEENFMTCFLLGAEDTLELQRITANRQLLLDAEAASLEVALALAVEMLAGVRVLVVPDACGSAHSILSVRCFDS